MRVIFAGPSLHGTTPDLSGISLRPPAAQGDLLRAVVDGASVIGLIDGAFEASASVWHKEILYALSLGVTVLGGASMGALRAAECAAFGMIPVGAVVQRYIDGASDDDADVAITHGPAELGSPPLTEALVDCLATIQHMHCSGVLSAADAARAEQAARETFYKRRTVETLSHRAFPHDAAAFEAAYRRHRISLKTTDALEVVARVRALPAARTLPSFTWKLNEPPMWRETLTRILSEANEDNSLAEVRG